MSADNGEDLDTDLATGAYRAQSAVSMQLHSTLPISDDIELEPDCLRKMLDFANAHPAVRLLSPVIHLTSDRNRIWYQGGMIDFDRMSVSHCKSLRDFRAIARPARPFISGCCLLAHRSVVEKTGLPDERFFLYYEDGDISLRAGDAGFGMDVVEGARCFHHLMAATGGYHAPSPLRIYHMLRSELLFWRKHLGFRRFHGEYCAAHLSKWFLGLDTEEPGGPAPVLEFAPWNRSMIRCGGARGLSKTRSAPVRKRPGGTGCRSDLSTPNGHGRVTEPGDSCPDTVV